MFGFLKNIASQLLPEVAGWLGGSMAKEATAWLADKVGLSPDASEDEIGNALKNLSPDKLFQLQMQQMECDARMKEMLTKQELELLKVEIADRENTRQMHLVTKDKVPAILTFCVLLTVNLVFALLAFVEIPVNSLDFIKIILSQLMALLAACVYFWVGTTRGSQSKNQMLAKK